MTGPSFRDQISKTLLSDELRPCPLSELFVNDCYETYLVERPLPQSVASNPTPASLRLFSAEVFAAPPEPRVVLESASDDRLVSGFLSTSDDHLDDLYTSVSQRRDEEHAPVPVEHPLSDDSATDRNDPKNPGSSQLCRSANVDVHGHHRDIDRDEEKSLQPNVLGMRMGDQKVMRPLSGKTCVVAPVNADYQPLFHNWQDPKEIPKIHLFYFAGYSQSPFDTPPVNVPKYFAQKEALREKRSKRKKEQDAVEPVVCEICRQKIKESGHRASHRHQVKVDDLIANGCWNELDRRAEELARMYGDTL